MSTTDLDARLRDYVTAHMPDAADLAIGDLTRMPEGWSRECFSFQMSWKDAEGTHEKDLILRKDPAGSLSTPTG